MRSLAIYSLLMLLIFFQSPGLAAVQEDRDQQEFTFFAEPVVLPDRIDFELALTNEGEDPLTFVFPSSQKYEILVNDKGGETVFRYSADKMFSQALQKITLAPNQTVSWTEEWNFQSTGTDMKPGEYQVVAKLKATKVDGKPISDNQKLTSRSTFLIPGEIQIYKNLIVKGEQGNYQVTGRVRPLGGKLFYTVEDGHNELIAETVVKTETKYPQWSDLSLSISIKESRLPSNGTLILHLYERAGQDEEMIHTCPVVLEKFY